MSQLSTFVGKLWRMYEKVESLEEPIGLYVNDDGDGLAAGYLISILLERLGKDYKIIVLDKAYPEIISKVPGRHGSAIFLDVGGPFFIYIPKHYRESVIVFDDHMGIANPPREMVYINPYKEGVAEDNSFSTSVMAYLVIEKVVEDPGRYVSAALLGLGESGSRPRGFINRLVAQGVDSRVVRREGRSIKISLGGVYREYKSLFRDVTLASMMGYYNDVGIDVIAAFRYGGLEEILSMVKRYSEERKHLFKEMFSLMDTGEMVLHKRHIQWVEDYKSLFEGVSTRIFDKFMSTASRYGRYFDPNKYILGVTKRGRYVSGFGLLEEDWLSIPIRATRKVETLIGLGRMQPINALAEASAYRVMGLGYGYRTQGSVVVTMDRFKEFLSFIDDLAGGEDVV